MALKAFEIKPTNNERYNTYGIYDVELAPRPEIPPFSGIPRSGSILPRDKGFSFGMDPPRVDFKVVRPMLMAGLGDVARKVLREKRRSYVTSDAIFNGVMKFGDVGAKRFKDDILESVYRELEYELKVSEPLLPLTYGEAARTIPQNTSPGLPFIQTVPGKKKGEIIDLYLDQLKADWDEIGNGKRHFPLPDCAAFARSCIGGPTDNKVRPVWAYPVSVVIAEAMFATPLIEQLTQQNIFKHSAYGMEMMKGGMQWLDSQMKRARRVDPGCKFILTDYSAFDSTVPAWLIRDCFAIIKKKMVVPANSKYYTECFRKIESYFINTVIRNSDGRRFAKDHGIPSGSMFTNIIGSMVNFIVSRWVIKTTMMSDPLVDVYFGDDAFICVRGHCLVNLDNMAKLVEKFFGMKINVKKSYWTTKLYNVHFLGYFNQCGTPYKNVYDLFASMMYPQHWNDDWSFSLARGLGCLMASAGNSVDVYLAVRSIAVMASRKEGAVDKAFSLIRENPRMVRHFTQMGVMPCDVVPEVLKDISYAVPRLNCKKIEDCINLI